MRKFQERISLCKEIKIEKIQEVNGIVMNKFIKKLMQNHYEKLLTSFPVLMSFSFSYDDALETLIVLFWI